MDPSIPIPSGGLPYALAIPALVFVVLTAIGVCKWVVNKVIEERDKAVEAARLAHDQKEKVREDMGAKLDAEVRRGDALELSFREHLEHDARVFRGEADRRKPARYETGDAGLDAKRKMTESVTGNLPADVIAKVRKMIDDGEIPV